MQAVVVRQYGPPEVLEPAEVPRPEVKSGQVLIRIHAASINPIDWRIRSGSLRLILPLRLPLILGRDVAGIVEAVGDGVHEVQVGDSVLCFLSGLRDGGYAEYVATSAKTAVRKPDNIDFVQAAAVPLVGLTALQGLRDVGQLRAGSRVLINGASGGVGHVAVQIAKQLGAHVTATCGTRNMAFVQELGADQVLDYSREDFTRRGDKYDLIFDAVAKSSFEQSRRALPRDGRYVTTVPSLKTYLQQALGAVLGGKRALGFLAKPRREDLLQLSEWLAHGKLRVEIQQTFPLARAAEAHRVSEGGHVRGKLVLIAD